MFRRQSVSCGLILVGFGLLSAVVGCAGGDDFVSDGHKGTGGSKNGSGGAGSTSASSRPPSATPATGGVAGQNDGAACASTTDCQSGFCVDGVCCESACNAGCQSCKIPGKEGKCSPYAVGLDPEGDCNSPDALPCEQRCDGSGACISCGDYACATSGCLTTCSTDADCKSTAYCVNGTCTPKKTLGEKCSAGNECRETCAEEGHCCKTECAAPARCGTGECLCGDKACSPGDACIVWHLDADGDGFGDPNKPVVGCASQPPSGGTYVANGDDCYDQNAEARPGQTKTFGVSRGDGSFDYDCDGQEEPAYPNITGKSCGVCGITSYMIGCIGQSAGWGCTCSGTTTGIPLGFFGNVPCGQKWTLYSCTDDPNTSFVDAKTSSVSATQLCR